jgi:ribosomal protein L7/L12
VVTDQDFTKLKHRVIHLEGQIAFLYEHLGLEFQPEPQLADDPRIVEQVKRGNVIEAIKIHRELNDSTLDEAKRAVEDMQARLGL